MEVHILFWWTLAGFLLLTGLNAFMGDALLTKLAGILAAIGGIILLFGLL